MHAAYQAENKHQERKNDATQRVPAKGLIFHIHTHKIIRMHIAAGSRVLVAEKIKMQHGRHYDKKSHTMYLVAAEETMAYINM